MSAMWLPRTDNTCLPYRLPETQGEKEGLQSNRTGQILIKVKVSARGQISGSIAAVLNIMLSGQNIAALSKS